jgi:hypothetical protein
VGGAYIQKAFVQHWVLAGEKYFHKSEWGLIFIKENKITKENKW